VTEQTIIILPWQRLALILGKLTFTVLISSQLAVFTWMFLAPSTLVLSEPTRAKGAAVVAQNDSIADMHIFGDATVAVVEVPKELDAPTTRLRLALLGVMAASIAENSSAIIAPKGGAGKNYRIGDVVQGRTKLAAVQQDQVILDSNGKLEALKFELAGKQGIQQSSKPTPAQKRAQTRGTFKERFSSIRTPADAVQLLKDEVSNDPAGALRKMGLETSGNGSGYKVSSSGSMLTQLGLRPGDIILSVNGQALGNLEDDQVLLEEVTNSGQARLEIQRGNGRFVVNHTIK
jgi:general secretion pathway protein C|tara:strand:+ start:212 stop:1081 length:870 start_codon:yes stop_codon:yes gene_type:complete